MNALCQTKVDERYRGAVPGVSERLADDARVLAREPVVAHAAPGPVGLGSALCLTQVDCQDYSQVGEQAGCVLQIRPL